MIASDTQKPLRVLYLGENAPNSTSQHRAQALRRIGCILDCQNTYQAYAGLKLTGKIQYLSGYRLVAPMVYDWLIRIDQNQKYDLVWVNGGLDVSAKAVAYLKKRFGQVVLYINDDPTGPRDRLNWATCRQAISSYDLCAVVRPHSELEFRFGGAKKVTRIWMSYDEVAHAPFASLDDIPSGFKSEVAFVGTWMRDEGRSGRDYFLLELVKAGIPVSIWGDRWHKSPLWTQLKNFWRGGSLGGKDYVAAIQGAKISLGFLSKGNRDLHTTRSSEIPYAGGLFCAERTSEHLQMYQEGVEAVFWSSVGECIARCRELLANDARREQIRAAGMKRIRGLALGNETICRKVLAELGYDLFRNEATDHFFRLQALIH